MKIIDLQNQVATVTSAASITLGAAVGKYRTVAAAIAAGDIAASALGVSFFVVNQADRSIWESGIYTLSADGSTLTQTSRTGSSNNSAAVAFGGVVCEVYSAADAKSQNALLSAADGVNVSALAVATSMSDTDSVLGWQGGVLKLIPAAVAKAYYQAAQGGSTPAAATGITLSGPTTGQVSVASTNFMVGVSPAGGTIAGTVVVTPSDNGGGGTFSPTSVSLTSANPTGTFTYTPSSTAGARTISVTNNGSLANPSSLTYTSTTAATQQITVATPATQTSGVAFNVTGTYANGTPTALEYRLSDDAAGVWTTASSPTIAGGNYSFSIVAGSATAGRTITVRDKTTQVASPASGSYAVNAATPDYPQFIQRVSITESGTGPYTYTGTANTNLSAARAMSVKKLPANGNGSMDLKIVDGLTTSTEMIFGVTQSATTVDYTAMPYGIYVKSTGVYSVISNGAVTGAKDITTSAAVNVTPANGDIMRLERTGSTVYAKVSKDSGATWTTLFTWTAANAKDPGGPGVDLSFEMLIRNTYAVQPVGSSGLV